MFREIITIVLVLFLSASVASASIVDANARQGGLDIGFGIGIMYSGGNLEYGFSDRLSVGIDYVTVDMTIFGGWIYMLFGQEKEIKGEMYDIHLNYQLVESEGDQPFNVSLLAGAGQNVVRANGTETDQRTFVVGGVCLSSNIISENLIGRLNVVTGPPLGVEVAWKITDNFELNAGITGISVVGIKISF